MSTNTMVTTTKAQQIEFLRDALDAQKELKMPKNLAERIAYTLKNVKSAVKSDLADLIGEVTPLLAKATAKKPVETSTKPKTKTEPKPEKVEDKSTKKPLKPKAKAEPKTEPPKAKTKKPKAKTKKPKAKDLFPATITTKELGNLKKVADKFTTYEELVNTINGEDFDGELYILVPWTPEQIEEFKYSERFDVPEVESFPENYDILQVVVACERVERFFAQSAYTDALFQFEGADLEPTEYTDGAGNVLKNRFSYNMEFEFYVPVK